MLAILSVSQLIKGKHLVTDRFLYSYFSKQGVIKDMWNFLITLEQSAATDIMT